MVLTNLTEGLLFFEPFRNLKIFTNFKYLNSLQKLNKKIKN